MAIGEMEHRDPTTSALFSSLAMIVGQRDKAFRIIKAVSPMVEHFPEHKGHDPETCLKCQMNWWLVNVKATTSRHSEGAAEIEVSGPDGHEHDEGGEA